MSNDKVQIQEKLASWAKETVDVYNPIADILNKESSNEKWGYYTQTPLSLVSKSPDLLILGINPGSVGGKESMSGEELLKGNPCFENKDKKDVLSDKDYVIYVMKEKNDGDKNRNGWALWHRLNNMLKNTSKSELLENIDNFVLSNMIFFGTAKEYQIPKIDKEKCAKQTLKLIDDLEPKVVILLGKQSRDLFNRITNKGKLEVLVPNSIYHCMYGKSHILAIKHTAYYYSNEEMVVVGKTIGFVLDHHEEAINKETICSSYIKDDIIHFEKRQKLNQSKRNVKTDGNPMEKCAMELKRRISKNGTNQWIDSEGAIVHEYYCKGRRGNYDKDYGTISVKLKIDNEKEKFVLSTLSNGNHPELFKKLISEYCMSKGWIKSDSDSSFSVSISIDNDKIVEFMTALLKEMKTYRETDSKE